MSRLGAVGYYRFQSGSSSIERPSKPYALADLQKLTLDKVLRELSDLRGVYSHDDICVKRSEVITEQKRREGDARLAEKLGL